MSGSANGVWNHFRALCRYVVLNPVRAKVTRKLDNYLWSSYRATAGLVPPPACLTIDWVLSQFGTQRQSAQQNYRTSVAEGIGQGAPWEDVHGQVLLGSEPFIERLTAALDEKRSFTEIPRQQRFAARPKLRHLFSARVCADRRQRNEAIRRAHLEYGCSLSEIGRAVGLHYSMISRIVSPKESIDAKIKI